LAITPKHRSAEKEGCKTNIIFKMRNILKIIFIPK